MNPEAVHPAVGEIVRKLSARPSVRRIILFGSRARGDNRPRSDIDLAVDAPGMGIREWSDVVEMVENAPTLLHIDLVRLDETQGEFREVIEAEGVELYGRQPARA